MEVFIGLSLPFFSKTVFGSGMDIYSRYLWSSTKRQNGLGISCTHRVACVKAYRLTSYSFVHVSSELRPTMTFPCVLCVADHHVVVGSCFGGLKSELLGPAREGTAGEPSQSYLGIGNASWERTGSMSPTCLSPSCRNELHPSLACTTVCTGTYKHGLVR